MSTLVTLKRRISVVRTIYKTAQALSMTSFAWLGRSKQAVDAAQAFCTDLAIDLAHDAQESVNDVAATPITRVVFLWGPQRGFCGSYSHIILSYALQYAQRHPDALWIPLGPHARAFVSKQGLRLHPDALALMAITRLTRVTYPAARSLILTIIRHSRSAERAIDMLYMHAESVLIARARHISCNNQDFSDTVLATLAADQTPVQVGATWRILTDHALVEYVHSQAVYSEHSARAVAMKTASTHAQETLQALSIAYHKARQAKITNDIIELSSGMTAS